MMRRFAKEIVCRHTGSMSKTIFKRIDADSVLSLFIVAVFRSTGAAMLIFIVQYSVLGEENEGINQ